MSYEQVFLDIYKNNTWQGLESRSGKGADDLYSLAVRQALPKWVEKLKVHVLLDIPCGDFAWMSKVELDVEYIGADIVTEIVEDNSKKYGNDRRKFMRLDLTKDDLPKADLILCRDCLVHLSNVAVRAALRNIKRSESTYLATTTFLDTKKNEYIPTGSWRPINMTLPPFNLPEPIESIDETPPSGKPLDGYWDKRLALWKVSDIPAVLD